MTRDIAGQIDFYNQHWRQFKYANSYKLARCAAILDAIRMTKVEEPHILDLGCGAGWLSAILGLFGPTLGVDLSVDAIRSARDQFPHVRYEQADIFDWQPPKAAFDIVVSQEVIEHVEDQSRYIQIAWEALKPKGYLILTTPNQDTVLAMPDEQRKNWSAQPIENWLTIKALKRLLYRSFFILEVQTVIAGLGHTGLHRLFNSTRIENLMHYIGTERQYERLRLALGLGLHIMVVARKQGG